MGESQHPHPLLNQTPKGCGTRQGKVKTPTRKPRVWGTQTFLSIESATRASLISGLLGFFVFVDDVARVVAFLSLFQRCRRWLFAGENRFAAHKILKAGRRKYEVDADGLVADGLNAHPSVGGNEHHASGMEVAFLVAEVDVSGSGVDGDNFILAQMFVEHDFVSGMQVLRSEDEMLGTVVLRTDFEHECSRRRITPNAGLAFVFLEQQWFGGGFRGRGRNEWSSRLGDTDGYEHDAREGKGLANSCRVQEAPRLERIQGD